MSKSAKQAKHAVKHLHNADRRLGRHAAKARRHPVVRAAHAVSQAADQPPLFIASGVTLAAGLLLRRPGLVRTGARMFLAHGIATGLKYALKRSVDRTRPEQAARTGKSRFKPGHSDAHELSSFPSGHTAGAVAVAKAVAGEQPQAAPLAAAAGGVAATQLPAGKHYLSDVIAGIAIGWLADTGAKLALRAAERALDRSGRAGT
ncbi:phosphatase PAP2 family protein [Sphingomonas sp. DT-204]|uniref:phosphatase PAP2 family protein n=1 Tax=Sphingomonas sp. DT-204 TaxID=3396166 RepID=UPI003F1C80A3